MAYLLTPEVSEDKVDVETAELKKLVVDSGGQVSQMNLPEKRQLAYPVKKQNYAYFGVAYFDIEPEGLDKIKKVLALHKKIMRYLVLNISSKPKQKIVVKSQTPLEAQSPTQSFDQRLESLLKS